MNVRQQIAVGVAFLMVFAYVLVTTKGESAIKIVAISAVVVAILVFPTAWNVIILFGQMILKLLSGISHGLGNATDTAFDWAEKKKAGLATPPKKASELPSRDELKDDKSQEVEELDVPEFMQ